jgi:hypothetical protein
MLARLFPRLGAAPALIRTLREIYPQATGRALAGTYALVSCVAAAAVAHAAPSTFAHMNAVLLLLWATTTAVAAACAGQAYVHSHFSDFDFVQHNEVGGFIVAVVGALYGVLLGFMTVIAWQHYAEARQVVGEESAAATDAWHASVGMPTAARSRVRHDMLLYAETMMNREWPAMRSGTYDKDADLIVMDAIGAAGNFVPANAKESNSQSATLQQLGVLHDLRWRRLADNESGISSFEWLVLLLGAACIVGFCWLFGLENRDVHLIMTSAVAIVVTATLVLLFELQYPFQSDLRISSGDWSGAVAHIYAMQSGMQAEMRM